MILSASRLLMLTAAVSLLPALAEPASAQSRDRSASVGSGVAITIRKGPSYLNTRTVARPATQASYDSSAVYQSSMPSEKINGFQRYPLPNSFSLPGF